MGYVTEFQELYLILEQFGYYDAQIRKVHFMDECACFSDVTVYPCYLNIEITTMQPFTYETQQKINEHIREWADENLTWKGCSGCEDVLDVDCRLFHEKGYHFDWAILEPLKPILINSALYTGKDAIDKVKGLVSGLISYRPIIVHLASQTKGARRKSFLVAVRKIDTYKDRIDLYTNVGMLPLYTDTPIPLTRDVHKPASGGGEFIEAIEIPNKIY